MTSWDIIKLVNFAVNRDVNSMAFTPDEYATMINAQSLKLFKTRLGNPDEYRGTPNAMQGVGMTKKIDKDLNPFIKFETFAVSGGVLDLTTANPAYINSIIPNPIVARGVDMIGPDEIGDRMANAITAPTLSDPVAYESGINLYSVHPTTLSSVKVSYYKYPSNASFSISFNSQTLFPVYTGTTELEWNDVNKVDIAYFIIRDAGLAVGRGDVTQMAEKIVNSK